MSPERVKIRELLLETGLFTIKKNEDVYDIATYYPDEHYLVGTKFVLILGGGHLYWNVYEIRYDYLTYELIGFDQVFEMLSPDLQLKMLFHLNLFTNLCYGSK